MSFTQEKIAQLLAANAGDAETQKARLAACHGKNICLVTCPYTSVGVHYDCYKLAKDMGFNVYVLNNPSSDFGKKLERDGIATCLEADMMDDKTAFDNALAAIEKSGASFDGVFTVHEISIPLASQLTDALGLPGNSALAAGNARDKFRARELCREAGLNSPRFMKVNNEEELEEAAKYVQFPAVAKPSSGAGSVGVIKVNSAEELRAAYSKIHDDITGSAVLNWNPGCSDASVTVEQYLLGDEFDVDILMWDREAKYVAVSDNWATFEPYFQETGSNCPSHYPADKIAEIKKYCVGVTLALGFTQGCFHVELKYTEDGPILIENNPRMGGGVVRSFNKEVFGVDLLENFMLSSVGIPINPPQSEEPLTYLAHYYINAMRSGTIQNTHFLKDLEETHEEVQWTKCYVKEGQEVKGVDQGFPQQIGEVCVQSHESVKDCIDLVNHIVDTMEYPIEAPVIADDIACNIAQTVG